jgi:hypothetical protein
MNDKPKVIRLDADEATRVLIDISAPMPRRLKDGSWWVEQEPYEAWREGQKR